MFLPTKSALLIFILIPLPVYLLVNAYPFNEVIFMKNSLCPTVDKSDIHFTLLVGACLWVKQNDIQLNEKWMQSSLK